MCAYFGSAGERYNYFSRALVANDIRNLGFPAHNYPAQLHIFKKRVQDRPGFFRNGEHPSLRLFFYFHPQAVKKIYSFLHAELRERGKKKFSAFFVFREHRADFGLVVCNVASSASRDKKFFPGRGIFFKKQNTAPPLGGPASSHHSGGTPANYYDIPLRFPFHINPAIPRSPPVLFSLFQIHSPAP